LSPTQKRWRSVWKKWRDGSTTEEAQGWTERIKDCTQFHNLDESENSDTDILF
jgi:hypothetical protein